MERPRLFEETEVRRFCNSTMVYNGTSNNSANGEWTTQPECASFILEYRTQNHQDASSAGRRSSADQTGAGSSGYTPPQERGLHRCVCGDCTEHQVPGGADQGILVAVRSPRLSPELQKNRYASSEGTPKYHHRGPIRRGNWPPMRS